MLLGLLWVAAWAVAGCVLAAVLIIVNGGGQALGTLRVLGTIFGIGGGLSGALFAVTLSIGERNIGADLRSHLRFACWGGIGGLSVPAAAWLLMRGPVDPEVGRFAPSTYAIITIVAIGLGAFAGLGTLRAALRAPAAGPGAGLTTR